MKKTTIDDLAGMVTKGFTSAKKDLQETEERLTARIKAVEDRLSPVEFLLSTNRIERLEDNMRQVKTILKIK